MTAPFVKHGAMLVLLLAAPVSAQKPVHVKGYTKKDGTYVPPHDRKAPEKITADPASAAAPESTTKESASTMITIPSM